MGDQKDQPNAPESGQHQPEASQKNPKETPEEKRERLEREKEAERKSVSERTALRTHIELEPPMTHNYELGEYEDAEVEGKYQTVEGSVDATPYPARLYKEKFYRDKTNAAKLLLRVLDNQRKRFTKESLDLIKKHIKLLDKLASQSEFDPEKFKQSFEKGHSSAQIFGTHGVYNFILTFQRVMDAYGHSEENLLSSEARISLKIGKGQKSKEERYVRTVSAKGDQPPSEPGKKKGGNDGSPENETEEYPNVVHGEGAPLMKTEKGQGTIVPSAEVYGEQVDVKVASTKLIESYNLTGMVALVSGLNKIPENQRQQVLDEIFKQMGEKDPVKAFQLMKEVIKYEREGREEQLIKGLEQKIENAPTENEKNYWRAQLYLFEMGQIDERGKPKLTNAESQKKMQEVLRLMSEITVEALPAELQEMAKEQKTFLEVSMRRNVAADMIETAALSLDGMMKNKKESDTYFETSFEELKKESRAEIDADLDNWYDSDAEVYMAASHVYEALRLLITHQYPKDARTEKIQNPVKHYYDKLMSGAITEIKLDEGEIAMVNDCLLDNPKTVTGPESINLNSLFVNRDKEKGLYEQYENGEEKLGEDSLYNTIVDNRDRVFGALGVPKGYRTLAGYVGAALTGPAFVSAALPQLLGDAFSDNRDTFLETDEGGFIGNSGKLFPPDGKLHEFMKNSYGNAEDLGSVETLQVEKIKQLMIMKHYDEARLLCIQILQDRLDEKLKMRPETMSKETELYQSLKEDYGEKVNAQVRLQLSQAGIDEKSFESKGITKPNGEPYKNLDEYIQERVDAVLQQKAFIQVQGVNAEEFTEEDVAGFTAYEKEAHDLLTDLNGGGWFDLNLKEETADIAKTIVQIVTEFALIELATWGLGTIPAVAGAGARVTLLAGEAAAWISRVPRIGGILARGAGYAGRGAVQVGRAAIFVEAQSAMHGRLVDPTSAEGAYQIALMAATLGVASKAQQFMRGATAGSKALAEAAPTGLARFSPLRPMHEAGMRLGQLNGFLRASGKGGTALAGGMEVGAEIGSLQLLHYAEQEATTNLDDIATYLKLEEAGLISKGTSERIKQYSLYRQAIKDPNTWSSLAQTAGVVLGLRGGRAIAGKLGASPSGAEIPTMKSFKFGERTYRPNQEIYIVGPEGKPVKAQVIEPVQVIAAKGPGEKSSQGQIPEPGKFVTGTEKPAEGFFGPTSEGAQFSPRLKVKVEGGKELNVEASEIVPPKTVKERFGNAREKVSEIGRKLREKLRRGEKADEPQLDSEGRIIIPQKISGRRAKQKADEIEAKEDAKAAEKELEALAKGEPKKKETKKKGDEFETPVNERGEAIDKKPRISGRRGRKSPEVAKPSKTPEVLKTEVADAAGKASVARENIQSTTNPERAAEFAKIAEKAADQAETSAKAIKDWVGKYSKESGKNEAAKETLREAELMAKGARESATIARHTATEKALESKYGEDAPKAAGELEAYLARIKANNHPGSKSLDQLRQKIVDSLNAQEKITDGRYQRRFDDVLADHLKG